MIELIHKFREQFSERGEFVLLPEESIKTVVRRENVAVGHGVYVISKHQMTPWEIIYIGKSGELKNDGTFGKQDLRGRLGNRQNNMSREVFFKDYIRSSNIAGLHFEWFVTFSGTSRILPSFAEVQLVAAYFGKFGRLPELNKSV